MFKSWTVITYNAVFITITCNGDILVKCFFLSKYNDCNNTTVTVIIWSLWCFTWDSRSLWCFIWDSRCLLCFTWNSRFLWCFTWDSRSMWPILKENIILFVSHTVLIQLGYRWLILYFHIFITFSYSPFCKSVAATWHCSRGFKNWYKIMFSFLAAGNQPIKFTELLQ